MCGARTARSASRTIRRSGHRPTEATRIERNRFGRHSVQGEKLITFKLSVGVTQVTNGAREEPRGTGAAASSPAAEVNRHRMLLSEFACGDPNSLHSVV